LSSEGILVKMTQLFNIKKKIKNMIYLEKVKQLNKALLVNKKINKNIKALNNQFLYKKKKLYLTRINKSCQLSGVGKNVDTRYRLNKHFIKQLANKGLIAGLKPSRC